MYEKIYAASEAAQIRGAKQKENHPEFQDDSEIKERKQMIWQQ